MDGLSTLHAHMSDTSSGNTSEGENIEGAKMSKRQFDALITKLGEAEGRGDNARPALFVTAVEATKAGILKEDDAEAVFTKYSQKVADAQSIGWKPQASAKQQISKLRVAIKLGLLPPSVDGLELCNRVIAAQKAQRAANDGVLDFSPFDGLVKVGRFQLRDPDNRLPDDVIDGLLVKPAGNTPEEADRLEKIMKACVTLRDSKEDPVSPESKEVLEDVASSIMTRIKELGGSTSMRKQAAKTEEVAAQSRQLAQMITERAIRLRGELST